MANTNTYAALSAAVYGNHGATGTSSEWIRLQNYSNSSSGFQAALFENSVTGARILAFAGTNPVSMADLFTDRAVLDGETPPQFDQALATYRNVIEQYGSANLTLTGHSLGGGLASYVAAMSSNSPSAVVFNSLGISKLVSPGDYPNVANYNSSWDPVTLFGPAQIGNIFSIEGEGLGIAATLIFTKLVEIACE